MTEPVEKVVLEHVASRAQQRLWFVEQLTPGRPVHNINAEFEVGADCDPDVLATALTDLAERHEALRTVLRPAGHRLHQVVLARLDPELATSDLSTAADPEAAWLALRDQDARHVFDLEHGPLLRVRWARLSPDRHMLALILHHAVVDAWSIRLLWEDLTAAYRARSAGRAPEFEPLPVQYADFTAWQEQRLTTPEAVADLAYWRERLADLPTVDLTRGRERPAEPDHVGGAIPLELDAGQVGALKEIAAGEQATLFMALTALWAEAVGRWFGCEDVPIGTSVAGRPRAELDRVVGMFVDRVVLRVDVSGRQGFRDRLRRVRDTVIDANEHVAVTFEQVVDAVQPARRIGLTPLFQVAVNLVPVSGPGQFGNGTVRHDLNLELRPVEDRIEAFVEHRDGVVSAADAEGLAAFLARLIDAAVADPDRVLRSVPCVPDPRAAVRFGPAAVRPESECLHDLLTTWARRTPDAAALVTPARSLTYRELSAQVNGLAHRLAALGVGPETPVLVALPRRAELVVGMLATLAAGGAYVPVDPAAPAGHLEFVAGDVGARIALVAPGAEVPLPDGVARVEVGPAAAGSGADGAADPGPVASGVGPANAAYVLYTSGTTGTPKGVVVEHRQLAGYAAAATGLAGADQGSSFLMVQPPTFDSCATQIYGALLTGGVLHLVEEDTARDPDALGDYCARHPIDYLKIVPSHLSALLADGGDRLRPRKALILGGEGSTLEFVRSLLGRGWPVLGHYGPTETTVGVLAHWIGAETGGERFTTPLGGPLAGVHAVLLDRYLDPVPPGCAGELHIGGDLVTRGYAGRPGRTADVFVPDPFSPTPGARLYRTGDLARELPDGSFEVLGRTDRQVKVNGHRIELAAIEAVLERLDSVRQAVAAVRGGRLVAYAVPSAVATTTSQTAQIPDEASLRSHLARHLPAYSVPAAVLVLPEIPQKSNGKIDYAALPEPGSAVGPRTVVAPASETETTLAKGFAFVLDLDAVSVLDPFFELGGDSIRVIHLVSEARRAGLPVNARDVFEAQSVRELAALVDERRSAAGAAGPADWEPVVPRLAETARTGITSVDLPAEVVADLADRAHVAYRTDPIDLLLAAVVDVVAARTGDARVAVGIGGVSPAVVEAADGFEASVRAAKQAARDAATRSADWFGMPDVVVGLGDVAAEPGTLSVGLAGGRLTVSGPCSAEDVADKLCAVVRHCVEAEAAHGVEDFPDAGLSAEQLDALFAGLGAEEGE